MFAGGMNWGEISIFVTGNQLLIRNFNLWDVLSIRLRIWVLSIYWGNIVTRMDTLERMPWKAQKAAFEKLMERAETANFTPEEQARYEAQLDAYRVMNSAMEKSKQEGKEEGKEEGIREGEKKKALEIALALKQRGLDVVSIAEISGLSVTEIENL